MTNEKTLKERREELQEEWKNAKLDLRAREAWIEWMRLYDWSVVGTLKFRDISNNKWAEYKVSDTKAQQTLNYYWNKIDGIFYGGRAEKHNERVLRSVVLQRGAYQNNIHYHFIAYHPYYTARELSQTLKEVWDRHIVESESSGKFEPVNTEFGWIGYMTHEWKILEQDTFEVFQTHLDTKHIFGYHNSESNKNDIRKRRLKIHSLTDSR